MLVLQNKVTIPHMILKMATKKIDIGGASSATIVPTCSNPPEKKTKRNINHDSLVYLKENKIMMI